MLRHNRNESNDDRLRRAHRHRNSTLASSFPFAISSWREKGIAIIKLFGAVVVIGLSKLVVQNINSNKTASIRMFGPSTALNGRSKNLIIGFSSLNSDYISYKFYTREEQRNFLSSDHGWTCQEAAIKKPKPTDSSTNLLVQRFDQLPPQHGIELWKYCVLYTGVENFYWQADNLIPLQLIESLLGIPDIQDSISHSDKSTGRKAKSLETSNIVIQIKGILSENNVDDLGSNNTDEAHGSSRLHHSLIKISKPKSKVALGMLRYLLDYDTTSSNNNRYNAAPLDSMAIQQTLSLFVTNDKLKKRSGWHFWTAKCQEASQYFYSKEQQQFTSFSAPIIDAPCSTEANEPCCEVWKTNDLSTVKEPPSLLINHLAVVDINEVMKSTSNALPYTMQDFDANEINAVVDNHLGMPKSHLPFVATVREYSTNSPPVTSHETPNYFDILLGNNCLPRDKDCFKCLKLGYKEGGDGGGDCTLCHDKCPCYCNALCQVRPPPKRIAAEWIVTPPRYRKNPQRLIPRIIHQTWFEPVTPEKYPNMSRLIQSFRRSGWEYEFYDDDKAATFLSTNFPPAVREAYDSLIPGAFKADLFRYCVLLIRGGLYADMDILLESNLDESIPPDVGFLTAQDSPGETIGHRSCLWNGLMAVAPAHPILAQTIQTVVNNIRNRFTSVDYDDMLCPNPVLSVSHTVDTLFTCGPCILGASLNDVLRRHRQTGFDYGEIDLFAMEKNEVASNSAAHASSNYLSLVEPDDQRWLIPGKTVLLKQNKDDMGSHRFTATDKNLIVAVTDMPEYDDRPKSIQHYSKSHVKFGVYGLSKLYHDQNRANEEVLVRIEGSKPFLGVENENILSGTPRIVAFS